MNTRDKIVMHVRKWVIMAGCSALRVALKKSKLTKVQRAKIYEDFDHNLRFKVEEIIRDDVDGQFKLKDMTT